MQHNTWIAAPELVGPQFQMAKNNTAKNDRGKKGEIIWVKEIISL